MVKALNADIDEKYRKTKSIQFLCGIFTVAVALAIHLWAAALAWFATYLGPRIGADAAVTAVTAYQNDMLPAILPMYIPMVLFIGIDRWGKEYASFSLPLCEKNAAAEGVKNASFQRGNAVKLDFPDESFDAVTSNYVYHNITGADKQALLLETLRVLKKGGTFAIHDLMSPRRYGDMQVFVQKLRDMGYERVELIDTTDGSFMTPKEARRLMLRGSTLLVGRK